MANGKALTRYTVMVEDNSRYMDEGGRREHGSFVTVAEALAVCRQIVDRSLAEQFKPGMPAEKLYELYTLFGEDAFVIASDGAKPVPFRAGEHARERAASMCAAVPR